MRNKSWRATSYGAFDGRVIGGLAYWVRWRSDFDRSIRHCAASAPAPRDHPRYWSELYLVCQRMCAI